jgi:hypothetical protein
MDQTPRARAPKFLRYVTEERGEPMTKDELHGSCCATTCLVLTVCRDTAELRQETWGVWGGRDSRAGQGLSQRTGAAPLARLVHERSALDDFEVLVGGLILVEMAEGD